METRGEKPEPDSSSVYENLSLSIWPRNRPWNYANNTIITQRSRGKCLKNNAYVENVKYIYILCKNVTSVWRSLFLSHHHHHMPCQIASASLAINRTQSLVLWISCQWQSTVESEGTGRTFLFPFFAVSNMFCSPSLGGVGIFYVGAKSDNTLRTHPGEQKLSLLLSLSLSLRQSLSVCLSVLPLFSLSHSLSLFVCYSLTHSLYFSLSVTLFLPVCLSLTHALIHSLSLFSVIMPTRSPPCLMFSL